MSLIQRIANRFKTGWQRLTSRISLWINKGNRVGTDGKVSAPIPAGEDEPRYVWELGATEKHCKDCSRLNGKVLMASEWQRIGIAPQSPDLECGGWRCDCRLTLTDEPSVGIADV